MNLRTTLRTYCFDVRDAAQKAEWESLQTKLKAGPHCHGPVLSNVYFAFQELNGQAVELETTHLFDNQWNTAPIPGVSDKGLRVFDWALSSHISGCRVGPDNAPSYIRRGHYLEQTPEMREIRRNTMACGYCGKQEAAAKGSVFCSQCIDSEYLKESDLYLTRMLPVSESGVRSKWAPLSEAESAHLFPLYRAAQLHGTTERGKARISKARRDILERFETVTRNATTERDGFLWLMDNGLAQLAANDTIFYSHTGRFCFGWRNKGVSPEIESAILAVISEFPFPYDIKTERGKTLSGN